MITLARSIHAVDKAHSLVSVFSVLKGLLQKSIKLVKSHSDRSLRFIALAVTKFRGFGPRLVWNRALIASAPTGLQLS